VEFCGYLNVGNSLPVIADVIRSFVDRHPSLPWNCPIKAGKYSSNFTRDYKTADKKIFRMEGALGGIIPNGIYRVIINFSTKDDPIGFYVSWQNEIHLKMGENDF
jgi:hypothetical protein